MAISQQRQDYVRSRMKLDTFREICGLKTNILNAVHNHILGISFQNIYSWYNPRVISGIPFHRHVQNVTIPCHSQKILPFLSVMYFILPPFSTIYSPILSHLILPSVSWSNVLYPATLLHQLFFHSLSHHHTIYFLVYLSKLVVPKFIYNTVLGILFPSILCSIWNKILKTCTHTHTHTHTDGQYTNKMQIWGASAKLRMAAISFVVSVHLSVCLHGKTAWMFIKFYKQFLKIWWQM